MDIVKRSVVARDNRGWIDKEVKRRGFLSQGNYSVRYYNGGHMSFVKSHRLFIDCTMPRLYPNVNYGLGVIMMY